MTATFSDAGHPVPGATVNFSVTATGWRSPRAGQPSPRRAAPPPTRTARPPFSFSGNRAGDYTVTASTTATPGQTASATHVEHLDINTFHRGRRRDLPDQHGVHRVPVCPGARHRPRRPLRLLRRSPRSRQGRPGHLPAGSAPSLTPGGTSRRSSTRPAATPTSGPTSPGDGGQGRPGTSSVVGAITLDPGEAPQSRAVIDPAGAYAYFGTWSQRHSR